MTRKAIEDYAKERFGENSGGLVHSKRVYLTAKKLSSEYDDEILHAACMLHDINLDKPHPKKAAQEAEKFLKTIGFPDDKLNQVLHAIDEHGFYGNPDSKEAFMLFDADQLDSMGITGFTQFAHFAEKPEEISRVLESIEREGMSILRLKKSKELALEKVEHRKKVLDMMGEELKDS